MKSGLTWFITRKVNSNSKVCSNNKTSINDIRDLFHGRLTVLNRKLGKESK